MGSNIKKMESFTLIITKDNYLEFLDCSLSKIITRGKSIDNYFLQRLKSLCRIVPEFTHQPILCHHNEMWCYDSEHYWEDNHGRCSLRFRNSYFGFNNNKVNKFEIIRIDYKSFGIKQVSNKKIHKIAGVALDYVTPAKQKLIEEQKAKWERECRINELKGRRAQLITELETLENEEGE